MIMLFWGITIGTIGKVVLGIAVLRVHMGILREHKIDGAVLSSIKRERWVTVLGIVLIITGYLIEVLFYGTTPFIDGVQ